MNNIDREQLVERYLNGELTGSQEQDFFIKVAVDNEMRRTLRALMIVDSAFRLDREGVSTDRPAVRARVMSTLAASSLDPAPTGSGGGSPEALGTGVVAASWGARLWKGALAVTASTALIVTSYLLGTGYFGSEAPEGANPPAAASTEHPGASPRTTLPGSSSGAANGSPAGSMTPQVTNTTGGAGEQARDLNGNDGASRIGGALGDRIGAEERSNDNRGREETTTRNRSRRDAGSTAAENRRNGTGTDARPNISARGSETDPADAGTTRSVERITRESESASPRPVVSDEDTMRLKVRMKPR